MTRAAYIAFAFLFSWAASAADSTGAPKAWALLVAGDNPVTGLRLSPEPLVVKRERLGGEDVGIARLRGKFTHPGWRLSIGARAVPVSATGDFDTVVVISDALQENVSATGPQGERQTCTIQISFPTWNQFRETLVSRKSHLDTSAQEISPHRLAINGSLEYFYAHRQQSSLTASSLGLGFDYAIAKDWSVGLLWNEGFSPGDDNGTFFTAIGLDISYALTGRFGYDDIHVAQEGMPVVQGWTGNRGWRLQARANEYFFRFSAGSNNYASLGGALYYEWNLARAWCLGLGGRFDYLSLSDNSATVGAAFARVGFWF